MLTFQQGRRGVAAVALALGALAGAGLPTPMAT
jgi:hypothetical protein